MNEEDMTTEEQVEKIFAEILDVFQTGSEIFKIFESQGTSLNKGFAVISLCSSLLIMDRCEQQDVSLEEATDEFFSLVERAVSMVSKMEKSELEGIRLQ